MNKIELNDTIILSNPKVQLQKINTEYGIENKIILPTITDDELVSRYNQIKPIVSIDSLYYFLKKYNIEELRNQSFLWNKLQDIRKRVDINFAEIIGEFDSYHTFDYYGIFKPSVAEVLEQIPDELLKDINAFYLFDYPKTYKDLNLQHEIVNAGCHQAKVRALKLKKR